MDFACIVLFLAFYYLKPQEWAPILASIHFIQLVMATSLTTLFFRERSLKIADFFRTPHDWAVFGFIVWGIISSPEPNGVFGELTTRYIFYIVTVLTLTSFYRLNKFLGWWTFFVSVTAILALAGEFFWDPLGSYEITHGVMKDRLVLNISMVNNPNALAHSLAPGVAMLYFFTIWKRPVALRGFGIAGVAIIIYAIYLTFSKGGYIVTALTLVAIFTFGRPKYVQIITIVLVISAGSAALYQLPRMNELQKSKTDEAIQGRIASFRNGYSYYQRYIAGVGYGNFMHRQLSEHKLSKAPHSVYNAIGAQQGKPGMFLFLLIMWCNLRTLLFLKTNNPQQERARRVLFTLAFSYMISGWLVDFAYRPAFFLFSAAISVLHRLCYIYEQTEEDKLPEPPAWRSPAAVPAPLKTPVFSWATKRDSRVPYSDRRDESAESNDTLPAPDSKVRRKFDWIDIVVTLAFLKLVEMAWLYFIHTI